MLTQISQKNCSSLRKRNDTLAEIGEFAPDQTVVRGVL
jgi:hypothetical protein